MMLENLRQIEQCPTGFSVGQRMGLTERLEEEQTRLEERLKEVNGLLKVLKKMPEMTDMIDRLSRLGIH